MALATFDGLSYAYPGAARPALLGASLAVEPGLTLVSGPSGGGKSTLLRVLNGLVPHFHGGRIAGGARVAGLDVLRTPTRRLAREVGFVFQDPELQAVYGTVEREVAFGLENLAFPGPAMAGRVAEALERVGASSLARRRLATLSGGERQRVALAAALALRPPIVALDEPTSQLDPEGARLLVEAALALAAGGAAVVVAEHRLERLAAAAHHRLHVEAGRLGAPPAEPPPARRPASEVGEVAWSLAGVAAGPAREAVLETVEACGRSGEVVVLEGPNGGGKTTLLRTLAGLLRPLAGRVERRPGRIAYLPQNPAALLHRPTVRDEVELTLRRGGDPGPPEPILERLGLAALAGRFPRDLSSGERQRTALAATLAGSPALVLLDEPTRGMDAAARAALAGLLGELAAGGAAVVLATHDAQLAAAVGDRSLRVAGGRVFERVPAS